MKPNEFIVKKWPADRIPEESAIRKILSGEGLSPHQWSNGSGDVYAAHVHPYHKVIYVLQGSIIFGLPDKNEKIRLNAGDRLDLPADTRHDAVVGEQGVVCLEAHG
jgi:quercetin dioxygenase-like cupin family protein